MLYLMGGYKTIRIREETYTKLVKSKNLIGFQLAKNISWDEYFNIILDALPKVDVEIKPMEVEEE